MGSKPGRKLLNWKKNPLLLVKSLAACVWRYESHNEEYLWKKTSELLPKATKILLGRSYTMNDVLVTCDVKFGKRPTPHDLYMRARNAFDEKTKHEFELMEPYYDKLVQSIFQDMDEYEDPDDDDIQPQKPERRKLDDRPLTSAETAEVRELLRTRPWEPSLE